MYYRIKDPESKTSSLNHISYVEYIYVLSGAFKLSNLILSIPLLCSKLVKSWHAKPDNASLGKAVRSYSRIFHYICLMLTQL